VVDLRDGTVLQEFPPPQRSSFPAVAQDGTWQVYSQIAPQSTWLVRPGARTDARQLSIVGGRVAVSSDGSRLALASPSRVECFETRAWRRAWSVPIELTTETSGPCAFSQDGRWLGVSLNGHDAALLDAATGRVLARFRVPNPPLVFGVNFGQNDSQLLVSTMHGLLVWNLPFVRQELGGLGLDWRDDNPSGGFAP
jgi:hypothetical protein